jgi:RecA-family ATPase
MSDHRDFSDAYDEVIDEPSDAAPKHAEQWKFHCITSEAKVLWTVKGVVPETGAGILSGQWGTFKTTTAIDLSLSVMTGQPFADRFMVKRRGAVAYFAMEGEGSIGRRLSTIAQHRGMTRALPFAWRGVCPPLTDDDAADQISALLRQADVEQRFGLPLTLVWIDTIIAAAGYTNTGDDNDTAAAQKVMSTLTKISQLTGAFVIGVDHFGKTIETGTRGSSAKEGSADTVLAILADRDVSGEIKNTRLAVRKQRTVSAALKFHLQHRQSKPAPMKMATLSLLSFSTGILPQQRPSRNANGRNPSSCCAAC